MVDARTSVTKNSITGSLYRDGYVYCKRCDRYFPPSHGIFCRCCVTKFRHKKRHHIKTDEWVYAA